MPSNPDNSKPQTPDGRVLFTGSGTHVIDDLMRLVVNAYQMEKCPPAELNFIDALEKFRPHAIVACLRDESRETLRTFSALEASPDYLTLPVIAIGNDDECAIFRKTVFQQNMQVFVRPLNVDGFKATLEQYVAEAREWEAAHPREIPGTAEKPVSDAQAPADLLDVHDALIKKIEKMTRSQGRKTVLVVDDDVRMLNVIKLFLQELYDVVVVPSGKLAIKYLMKKTADLVLLDYLMPEEDGPAVLQKIREDCPQPDIPVLFLTGVDDKEMVLRGLEYHPNGYLLKPVTREFLVEKVTEALLGL